MRTFRIHEGDALAVLKGLPGESVQTCVTSPPYFGLRDYGTAKWEGGDENCDHVQTSRPPVVGSSSTLGYPADGGKRRIGEGNTYHEAYAAQYRGECGKCGARRVDSQIGLEETPEAYVSRLVGVFREVRRVLKDDGTLWLNLGDSYVSPPRGNKPGDYSTSSLTNPKRQDEVPRGAVEGSSDGYVRRGDRPHWRTRVSGDLKPKDLIGIPWMVAFALRADGWYLRSDIIWHKPNPMPESVTDRPTKAHEYIFLLSKSASYFYDADAIKEQAQETSIARALRGVSDSHKNTNGAPGQPPHSLHQPRENVRPQSRKSDVAGLNGRNVQAANSEAERRDAVGCAFNNNPRLRETDGRRNKRSVWTVSTKAFPEAHFATFNPELIEPCILAGSREGDTVLDPFTGSGTSGLVALRLNRNFIGAELNPTYAEMARRRIRNDAPLLNREDAA